MSQPTPTPTTPFLPLSSPQFDQVVEGNVDIKKLSKYNYRITVSEISKFLKYQVWSDSSKKLNEKRSVFYQKANKWVNNFNSLNAALKASNKPLFTPTTVMEIGNDIYVFVINKAKLKKSHNKNDKDKNVVFTVSTKEIELSNGASKKLLKLRPGHHDKVRFDIDSQSLEQIIFPLGSNMVEIGAVLYPGYVLNWELLGIIPNTTTSIHALWSTTQNIAVVTTYGGTSQYVFATTNTNGGKGLILAPLTNWESWYPEILNLIMANPTLQLGFSLT